MNWKLEVLDNLLFFWRYIFYGIVYVKGCEYNFYYIHENRLHNVIISNVSVYCGNLKSDE